MEEEVAGSSPVDHPQFTLAKQKRLCVIGVSEQSKRVNAIWIFKLTELIHTFAILSA